MEGVRKEGRGWERERQEILPWNAMPINTYRKKKGIRKSQFCRYHGSNCFRPDSSMNAKTTG